MPKAREDEQAALTAARAVHRLSARLPRRALRHEPAAARPLPDAGRSRRLAGADLRAARRAGGRHRARRLAVGDDAAALRGLQGRRGAAVLPRSFRAARPPDRAGRRARRASMPDPTRCAISKRALAAILDCFRVGRSTLFSSLFRPRIDRILFAATKADHLHHSSHDRLEAILARMVAKRGRRAPTMPAPRSTWSRSPPCARRARRTVAARPRQAAVDPRHAGRRRERRWRDASTARPRSRSFRATCLPIRRRCSAATAASAASSSAPSEKADYRFLRFRPPLLEATATTSRRCRISASTARSNS